MLRVPKKGSIEWVPLYPDITKNEEFKGVSVGIKHVGPVESRRWACKSLALSLEETKRVADHRKGYTRDQAPELWEDGVMTPEAAESSLAMVNEVLGVCCAGIKGVEGAESMSGEECVEFLGYLDVSEGIALMNLAIQQQSLKPAHLFRTENSGNVESGATA